VARALAHPLIALVAERLRARRPAVIAPEESARRAAVALILRVGASDVVELLMIKRAAYEGDPWSGHIALPGGRSEPGDRSLEETAIRETREETAVDLARDGWTLGRLDDLKPGTVVLPRLVITPFVGVLGGESPVVVSSPEVAEAFWVPLSALRDPNASREVVLELAGGPRRVTSFQHGGHTIWGLTERILRQFLALLDRG
jgi:8-oxo-dGTP pyrophosphatase MutT (NUDIX family)